MIRRNLVKGVGKVFSSNQPAFGATVEDQRYRFVDQTERSNAGSPAKCCGILLPSRQEPSRNELFTVELSEDKTMKTLIHKKAKTVSEKLINNADVKQFSGNDVMAMLAKLQAAPTVGTVVEPIISGIVSKAPKTPSKKPSKPKQLVVKLYNSKTNAHEELSLDAQEYCDLKLYEVIEAIRADGFSADAWSFKIRIPVGL